MWLLLFFVGARGDRFFLGSFEQSCNEECLQHNMTCTPEGLLAGNAATSSEVSFNTTLLLASSGKSWCGSFVPADTKLKVGKDIPTVVPTDRTCWLSRDDRTLEEFDCLTAAQPGKKRLCYCIGASTFAPTGVPTSVPPTAAPSTKPPTTNSTSSPSSPTSLAPSASLAPSLSVAPSLSPSLSPSLAPSSSTPTLSPSIAPTHHVHTDAEEDDSLDEVRVILIAVSGSLMLCVILIAGAWWYRRRKADQQANLLMPLNGELTQLETESLEEYSEAASVFVTADAPKRTKPRKNRRDS